MKPRVIETEYNGIKFRSRTEARWAVFMDRLGIRYDYEAEGYDLGDGIFYLPDFWLPDQKFFLEIKPEAPTRDECAKASLLAQTTKRSVFVAYGSPRPIDLDRHHPESAHFFPPSGGEDIQYWWCECPNCHRIDIQFNGRAARIACNCPKHDDKTYNYDTPRLNEAHLAAASHRFWEPQT